MKRILRLIWQFGLLAGGRLFADVVTPKDGRQISGLVKSGNIQKHQGRDQSLEIVIHRRNPRFRAEGQYIGRLVS
jgi:hypothetical protein